MDESHLADEYVQEFVLSHLDDAGKFHFLFEINNNFFLNSIIIIKEK